MNDKFFIDTNIFVYSFDSSAPHKQKAAQEIIKTSLTTGRGIISFQVIQEFLNVALKKFLTPLSITDARIYYQDILIPLCTIFPGNDFYLHGLDIKERTGFSFYDSLIISAALEGECSLLYTEDLQDGFKLYGLTVKNPFQ